MIQCEYKTGTNKAAAEDGLLGKRLIALDPAGGEGMELPRHLAGDAVGLGSGIAVAVPDLPNLAQHDGIDHRGDGAMMEQLLRSFVGSCASINHVSSQHTRACDVMANMVNAGGR
jgi:hypothetical protein